MYKLQEKLGSGGFSSVYKCVDHLGIRYACKVMDKQKNKRHRVQQEIEMLSQLNTSMRVARIIDAREDDTNFYVIQEWYKGGMLKDYVSKYDVYAENTVASIVRGILRGLYHIHSTGIVHRDIKGPNIVFSDPSPDADIRIIDFGAAMYLNRNKRGVNDLTPSDDIVGTPWYMAPEALSYKFGMKTDIWSVGVLTYQLLCGHMPFDDRESPSKPSILRIFKSIYMDEPNMSSDGWKHISPEARDFVLSCLQKDVHKRPLAEDALNHPWLTSTDCSDRFTGVALECSPFLYENDTLMNAMSFRKP